MMMTNLVSHQQISTQQQQQYPSYSRPRVIKGPSRRSTPPTSSAYGGVVVGGRTGLSVPATATVAMNTRVGDDYDENNAIEEQLKRKIRSKNVNHGQPVLYRISGMWYCGIISLMVVATLLALASLVIAITALVTVSDLHDEVARCTAAAANNTT
jgi:acetylornithine deacetylase/succinyl-diaminopimelate desuccinylase-like protein